MRLKCAGTHEIGVPLHFATTLTYPESTTPWNARQLRAPLCEADCGGGVWRLKWHSVDAGLLLGACMHAGFAVLHASGMADADVELADVELEVKARYEAHGTGTALGYGADWAHGAGAAARLGATCSFYDRALHAWNWTPPTPTPC